MPDNQIVKSHRSLQVAPDDWINFSCIWFETCRHFKLPITHHSLAVAMHKADEGQQTWEAYLTRAEVECQRQWDLEDLRIHQAMQTHEQQGVEFLPTEKGWEIRVYDTYIWQWQSVKAWLAEYDAQTAWFYEADGHLLPAQPRAERLAGVA